MKKHSTFPEKPIICVVGLGYVGLPLAVEFGKHYETVGFDINKERVQQLKCGLDSTRELDEALLTEATELIFTTDEDAIKKCDIYVVTVPTPVDKNKNPDLSPLISASEMLGKAIDVNNIVIFESTVYPGVTEEVCAPIITMASKLELNRDYFLGYSPERINPGDKKHRVSDIVKITSGSTPGVAAYIDKIYSSIITAGTFRASSIKVAEAAKVIENTQRDINIALMNELAIIFSRLNIDTSEVLEAACTKWNFLPFKPGLVGGHCISVDPYYLTHKAQEVGYNPEIITAGRRINDSMAGFVTSEVLKLMLRERIEIIDSRVLIFGLTFKENCPDTRNTRVIDIVHEFQSYNAVVDVYDPWIEDLDEMSSQRINIISELKRDYYDAIIVAVAHDEFRNFAIEEVRALGREKNIIYDVKSLFPAGQVSGRL